MAALTTAATAPTGEAVNYETTIAELEALAETQRAHVEQATAALAAVTEAKSAISEAQQSYRPAAEAAASVHQHLTALNLDAETLGHTGTVADSMPPNMVDGMFAQLEGMEATARQQVTNAEVALASTEAALTSVTENYGEMHAGVSEKLGGDATFLHSSGAGTQAVAA